MLLTQITSVTGLEAIIYGLLGYGVVFLGLILLMLVLVILGKIFVAAEKKQSAKTAAIPEEIAEAPKPAAPGSAGQLSLNNVDPKTAAILMAIVADKLQKPINELRFISVKEVTK